MKSRNSVKPAKQFVELVFNALYAVLRDIKMSDMCGDVFVYVGVDIVEHEFQGVWTYREDAHKKERVVFKEDASVE